MTWTPPSRAAAKGRAPRPSQPIPGLTSFLALAKTSRAGLPSDGFLPMRRLSTLFVLCAWLLASGAHWDLAQGFGWARMVVNYSRSMPLEQAVRLTFSPENLCGVCEFVADGKTRAAADGSAQGAPVAPESAAKGKLVLATAPEHLFVFGSAPAPSWPAEHFLADAHARPAPPTEPPRAA